MDAIATKNRIIRELTDKLTKAKKALEWGWSEYGDESFRDSLALLKDVDTD